MEITIKWTVDSKSDEEAKKKVMELLKNAHGTLLPWLPDWDPETLRDEIQDLKLENDRLQQRDKIMWKALVAIGCNGTCEGCLLEEKTTCDTAGTKTFLARTTLKELEDIG